MIERGRYFGIPREERFCPHCDSGEIEDEIHFIFKCQYNAPSRENLLSVISASCHLFNNLSVTDKFLWLMNCEDVTVLSNLSKFILDK